MPKGLAGFPKAASTNRAYTSPFIEKTWVTPTSPGYFGTGTCSALSATTVQCTAVWFNVPVMIDGYWINVVTLQAASTVEVGVYSTRPGGRPDQRLARLGLVDSSTAGTKQIAINPTYIPAGDHVVVCYSALGVALKGFNANHDGIQLTNPDNFPGGGICGLKFTVGFTSLPDRFTGSEVPLDSSAGIPAVAFSINKVLPS